jgi:carbonyl reductase 1
MQRVAVVSGANRGIGLEIARKLGQRGLRVVLGSRSLEAGEACARTLASEGHTVEARQLDVASDASVRSLAEALERAYGGIDVLVNNAGVALDGFDERVAARTLDVNFFGAMRLTDALLPRMRAGGRVVMVSSGMGEIAGVSPALGEQFMRPDLSREALIALAKKFVADVAAGRHRQEGWPTSAYRVSKISVNALTRILARELADDPRKILVNTCCPGWVRTAMGGPGAPTSPEQGAETPVWLALLPEGGPTGGFFREKKPIPW